jgi:hypothetical protein
MQHTPFPLMSEARSALPDAPVVPDRPRRRRRWRRGTEAHS